MDDAVYTKEDMELSLKERWEPILRLVDEGRNDEALLLYLLNKCAVVKVDSSVGVLFDIRIVVTNDNGHEVHFVIKPVLDNIRRMVELLKENIEKANLL